MVRACVGLSGGHAAQASPRLGNGAPDDDPLARTRARGSDQSGGEGRKAAPGRRRSCRRRRAPANLVRDSAHRQNNLTDRPASRRRARSCRSSSCTMWHSNGRSCWTASAIWRTSPTRPSCRKCGIPRTIVQEMVSCRRKSVRRPDSRRNAGLPHPALYALDLNPGLHPLARHTPPRSRPRAAPPQDLGEARDGRSRQKHENPSGPTCGACVSELNRITSRTESDPPPADLAFSPTRAPPARPTRAPPPLHGDVRHGDGPRGSARRRPGGGVMALTRACRSAPASKLCRRRGGVDARRAARRARARADAIARRAGALRVSSAGAHKGRPRGWLHLRRVAARCCELAAMLDKLDVVDTRTQKRSCSLSGSAFAEQRRRRTAASTLGDVARQRALAHQHARPTCKG